MPQVLNGHHLKGETPDNAVLVDRTTKWGNIYTHLPAFAERNDSLILVDTREIAIDQYEKYLYDCGLWLDLPELKGRDLICWCKPKPCHGDVLLKLANALPR